MERTNNGSASSLGVYREFQERLNKDVPFELKSEAWENNQIAKGR